MVRVCVDANQIVAATNSETVIIAIIIPASTRAKGKNSNGPDGVNRTFLNCD